MSFQEEPDRIFELMIDHPYLQGELRAQPISFRTEEELSDSQKFYLEMQVHKDTWVDLNKLLGEGVHIYARYRSNILPFAAGEIVDGAMEALEIEPHYIRHYYGYVTAGYDLHQHGDYYVYKLEMSTWLWFLGQNRNSRIFQQRNILGVIQETFSRYSEIANFELDIAEDYPDREYCVQFGETDLNFINRLLEEEGIWYYFRHEWDKHTMVITDKQQFGEMPGGYNSLPWQPSGSRTKATTEGIQEMRRSRKVRPNEVILRDYDYLRPSHNLQVDQELPDGGLPNVQLEWYDYAAGYQSIDRGEKIARLRLQLMQSERQMLSGKATAIGLVPGYGFSMFNHGTGELNRRYKLLSVHYNFVMDRGGADPGDNEGGRHRNQAWCSFIALNDDVPNRPQLRTPRPEVPGLQSATVVGTPGSEVYTDEHARIKVHFHWDRYRTREEDSSCWVRVVQAWAGKGWGVIAMPRVGQEVLITYVDGDLDRPLVTGIVYNGENPPPYDLPREIGHTGIKSRSLKHGSPQNYSEITLVDDRGAEKVLIHAERDQTNSVERDLNILVQNNRYDYVRNLHHEELNLHYYTGNIRYSVTGLAVQLTTLKKDFTALHCGNTMVDFLFTGMSTSFTGINTTTDMIGTHLTGLKTNLTALETSMTGIDNELFGMKNKLGVMENVLQANRNSFTALNNEFVGMDNAAVVNSNRLVGINNNIVGVNTELYGINTIRTGNFLNLNAAEVSIVGVRNENYGSYVGNMGVRIDNTGTTINNTGFENRTVGLLLIN
jgi:type VI secretion system secreted protein VgrG